MLHQIKHYSIFFSISLDFILYLEKREHTTMSVETNFTVMSNNNRHPSFKKKPCQWKLIL